MKELHSFIYESLVAAYSLNREASIMNIETGSVRAAGAVC